jgi:peptidoglycan hydrolase CwlO-like protein
MINDKEIDACRTFSCDHELHEDCINAMATEIDELAQEVHSLQCATTKWKVEIKELWKKIKKT